MLGVQGVVTLNEPYETLVPSGLYQASYLFPSIGFVIYKYI
jgi:hypothetical protein